MITQERLKELLKYNPETGEFVWKLSRGGNTKGTVAGNSNNRNYIQIKIDKKLYKGHRLAFLWMTGSFPKKGLMVDHINRNPSDNRWCNLRVVTSSENQQNSSLSKANSSGFKGVSFCKTRKRWVAQIAPNRKNKHLGYFLTKEEAYQARLEAEKERGWLTNV